jgi:hypothetical protein
MIAAGALCSRHSPCAVDYGFSAGDIDLKNWFMADGIRHLVPEIIATKRRRSAGSPFEGCRS